jgi:hypothetical protein
MEIRKKNSGGKYNEKSILDVIIVICNVYRRMGWRNYTPKTMSAMTQQGCLFLHQHQARRLMRLMIMHLYAETLRLRTLRACGTPSQAPGTQ